jgi:predicted amidohydrolase
MSSLPSLHIQRTVVSFFIFCILGWIPPLLGSGNGLRIRLNDFSSENHTTPPSGWRVWAQREEIQPRCYIDSTQYRSAPDALAISGNSNAAEYGGWSYQLTNVQGGRFYRLVAYYRTQWVQHEELQIVVRLDWRDGNDHRVGQPDYAYTVGQEGDWKKLTMQVPAPEKASHANLELALAWSPQGTVWWDDITFEEAPALPDRIVRIGSVGLRPRDTGSKEGSVNAFLQALDRVGTDKPDIVCLGEGITKVGNGENYVTLAEPIPGPTTERLSEKARRYHMYIVAGLFEREGNAVYNTAVLIDRQGMVSGKYRKVYLPREEIEGGLTPGVAYPVFQTDFGKVGIMICWDLQYADPARALAAKGAEIILMPIWGGNYTLMKARAIENHVFLVSAGYDVETAVINPNGEPLHATKESGVIKTLAVNLNERFLDPWLGDMRARFHKEIRWDVPVATFVK